MDAHNGAVAAATAVEAEAPQADGGERGEGRRRGRGRDRNRRERTDEAGLPATGAPTGFGDTLPPEAPAAAPVAAQTAWAAAPAMAMVAEAPVAVVEPAETTWRPDPAAAAMTAPAPLPEAAPVAESGSSTVARPVDAVEPAPALAPAPAEPFVLPVNALQAVVESSGLQWVGSDADKIRAVQDAMAREPKAAHVPRERKAVAPVDEGALVLVETRKDLSQIKLPFETAGREAPPSLK